MVTRGVDAKIVLLGPRRSGKTSLLAAIFQQLREIAEEVGLSVGDSWRESRSPDVPPMLTENTVDFQISVPPGIHRNRFRRPLPLRLRFVDSPTGWIGDEESAIAAQITSAHVVIITIDTPYLMELNGIHHEGRHHTVALTRLIRSHFLIGDIRKLLLLVPTRCEKYFTTDREATLIQERVKQGFSNLIAAACFPQCATSMVLTPVQTLGALCFAGFRQTDAPGIPAAVFSRSSPDAIIAPRFADQPVRHLLAYVIREQIRSGVCHRLFQWNSGYFGVLHKLSEGCKVDGGFEILLQH